MENKPPTLPVTFYIRDFPLRFCLSRDEGSADILTNLMTRHLVNPGKGDLLPLIKLMEKGKVRGAVVEGEVGTALEELLAMHQVWPAAGGLVEDQEGRVLLMFRRGKWDLPKGKLDPGETLEQCALREISEETGLVHLRIESTLTETWHSYLLADQRILKHTFWFRIAFTGTELTVPQVEEDIQDIQWVLPGHLPKYLIHAHANIREVARSAGLVN